jgi:hypothetical protein
MTRHDNDASSTPEKAQEKKKSSNAVDVLLIFALMASALLNIFLLSGCLSVSTPRDFKNPPEPLNPDLAVKFASQLKVCPEEQTKFNLGLKLIEEAQGNIVVLIPDTEKVRNAKRILITFED